MPHSCLDCGAILTLVEDESTRRTEVLRCGDCDQGFLKRTDENLRPYRRGPFIGLMHALIYEENPPARAAAMADDALGGDDIDGLEFLLRSGEAELRTPSQRLDEAHEFQFSPSEDSLREFLRLFAERLRAGIAPDAG